MTTPLVRQWLDAGELNLPLPASGDTVGRWLKLTELTEVDVVAGRLAEAHTDAVAILAELGGPRAQPGQLWGVWAAEAPGHRLTARHDGDGVALGGVKPWCSGSGLCSHALVTAHGVDGDRELFAVDLAQPGVTPLASSWRNAGMATSDTRSVRFDDAPAMPIGAPGDYLARPGFWHGAIGVAACWLGGARAVAARLYRAVADTGWRRIGKPARPGAPRRRRCRAGRSRGDALVCGRLRGHRTQQRANGIDRQKGTGGGRDGRRGGNHSYRPCAGASTPGPRRRSRPPRRRPHHVRAAEPRRTGSGRAGTIGMPVTGTGNAARFAARPLSGGGTTALAWAAWAVGSRN